MSRTPFKLISKILKGSSNKPIEMVKKTKRVIDPNETVPALRLTNKLPKGFKSIDDVMVADSAKIDISNGIDELSNVYKNIDDITTSDLQGIIDSTVRNKFGQLDNIDLIDLTSSIQNMMESGKFSKGALKNLLKGYM